MIEYVGLYNNVEKIYECDEFIYYKWYDKAFIVSKVPSEYYKKNIIVLLLNNIKYNDYSCAVIELSPEYASVIDFINNEENSKHIINNYIIASNKKSCALMSSNELEPESDEYEHYLREVTSCFPMKYIKFREGDTDVKFYNVRFFKLDNDLVELLET